MQQNENNLLEYNSSISNIVNTLTKPLLVNFAINTFTYTRIYENKILRISNNEPWNKFHISNKFYELDHYQNDIKGMSGSNTYITLWNGKSNTNLIKGMHAYGLWYGLSIYQKCNGYIEMWSFASREDNSQIESFYFNNIHLLERFIVYFKNKASELIDIKDRGMFLMRKKDIILDPCIQNNFEKNFYEETSLNSLYIDYQSNIKATKREVECLYLLSTGRSAKEIGLLLNISSRTVEYYINQLKLRLGCHYKNELILRLNDDLIKYYQVIFKNN